MDAELVEVEVVVNVDSLRRGWVGQVELTDRIGKLISSGYLRLIGHVQSVPQAPVVTPAALGALAPTEAPAARAKRSRAKPKATTTLVGEVGDDGGQRGVRLE